MPEQERKLNIQIRPARPGDAEFLAWLILTAGRAHVTRGIWEVILDGFKIVDEKRHPHFETEIGSPGMACMLQNI